MSVKYDEGKPRLGLFPTQAILAGGRALTYGVEKYSDYNYKNGEGLDWNRYYDALLRHLFAWIGGEDNDKESKLSHLDHVMACCAMLADAVNSGIGKDTRFNTPKDAWDDIEYPSQRGYECDTTTEKGLYVIKDYHKPAVKQ